MGGPREPTATPVAFLHGHLPLQASFCDPRLKIKNCLVSHPKNFYPSYRIFGHMHRTLNVDKKNKLITQFG